MAIENVEGVILHGLLFNEEFSRKALPFIKEEYFQDFEYSQIFKEYNDYVNKYNRIPTCEALDLCVRRNKKLGSSFEQAVEYVDQINSLSQVPVDSEYMTDVTEEWCKNSAFYNVIVKAADSIDDDKNNISKGNLPEEMAEALAITFDTSVGHDYFEDALSRFESWHEKIDRLPFALEAFNRITKGGLPPKTLTVLMSSITGGFKSGTMCDWASKNLMDGKNVLYITMELAEEVVAERIDANLLDVELDDLRLMSKNNFLRAIEKNREKTKGKLVVKEYPTSSAHSGHFRYLLKELEQKHGFKPDVIYVDYLNICQSARLPPSALSNPYLYIKTIAEELRGLAVEFGVPVVSATQSNRGAAGADDVSIDDISESYGLTFVVDLLLGVITTPENDELGQIIFKQLKNRFADINKYTTFPVGANKAKMTLYDIDKNKSAVAIPTGGYKVKDNSQMEKPSHSPKEQSKKAKFKDFNF